MALQAEGQGDDTRPQPRSDSLSSYMHASGAGFFDPEESSCVTGRTTEEMHSVIRLRSHGEGI